METTFETNTGLLELLINDGFPDIKFGASMEEVTAAFGSAGETDMVDENEETDVVIWHYWDMGISVFFEQEAGFCFSSAEVSNENTTIWGKKVFDMNKDEIKALFEEHNFKEIETETHEWGEERLSIIDAMVDCYFEQGNLVSVNFGKLLL